MGLKPTEGALIGVEGKSCSEIPKAELDRIRVGGRRDQEVLTGKSLGSSEKVNVTLGALR